MGGFARRLQKAHPSQILSSTPWLPFNMPVRSTMAGSSRKVWYHWMGGAFPISLDNKNPATDATEYWRKYWLPPGTVEGSRDHNEYGGFVRQRKLSRAPLGASSLSYEVRDKMTEIDWIVESGADGLTAEMLGVPSSTNANPSAWLHLNQLMDAADEVADPTFTVTLMPDCSTIQNNVSEVASALNILSTRRVTKINGQMVIAPYAPENFGATFWSNVISTLSSTYGVSAVFWPCFQASWKNTAQAPTFNSISYGFSMWGTRNPVESANSTDPTYCHTNYSKPWMQPVSVGDERPRSGNYNERRNTDQLVASWMAAINAGSDCDWVQMPTWDDFAEGAQICPVDSSGFFWLDVNAYFLTRYKTGVWPTIVRDAIYLSHRRQPTTGVTYTSGQTLFQTLIGNTPAVNTVEALVFSTQTTGTVEVTVGGTMTSFNIASLTPVVPGVYSCKVALANGTCSAVFKRNSTTIASVTSPTPVSTTQVSQDMSYYGASSLR